MYLSPRDKEVLDITISQQRASIQAAAYTVYVQLTPNNKKPVTQREFHQIFKDNWQMFYDLEYEDSAEDV